MSSHPAARAPGPPIAELQRHAIAVRVLDAVRSMGRTFGHVGVAYELRFHDDRPTP